MKKLFFEAIILIVKYEFEAFDKETIVSLPANIWGNAPTKPFSTRKKPLSNKQKNYVKSLATKIGFVVMKDMILNSIYSGLCSVVNSVKLFFLKCYSLIRPYSKSILVSAFSFIGIVNFISFFYSFWYSFSCQEFKRLNE